jgi:hypothetical protein
MRRQFGALKVGERKRREALESGVSGSAGLGHCGLGVGMRKEVNVEKVASLGGGKMRGMQAESKYK